MERVKILDPILDTSGVLPAQNNPSLVVALGLADILHPMDLGDEVVTLTLPPCGAAPASGFRWPSGVARADQAHPGTNARGLGYGSQLGLSRRRSP